jgi:hypothetical protein
VNDVEIEVVETESFQTTLSLGNRVLAPGMELRCDEDLVARHATLA